MLQICARFAFSILVNAGRYPEIRDAFPWNDIVPPSRATFYRVEEELCRKEGDDWKNQMKPNAIIAFDRSWSHRRRAKECVVLIVELQL
jgi:hypothetical protein